MTYGGPRQFLQQCHPDKMELQKILLDHLPIDESAEYWHEHFSALPLVDMDSCDQAS